MPRNFYPPEGHDFVNTSEIRELAKINERLIKINYQDEVAVFRAAVIMKLIACEAIGESFGWAIFQNYEEEEDAPVSTLADRKETLLLMGLPAHQQDKALPMPNTRLITRHTIRHEDKISIISEDVLVDWEGDAQYITSFVPVEPEDSPQESDVEDTLENKKVALGDVDMGSSYVVLFSVDDEGKLGFTKNVRPHVPILNVPDPQDENKVVVPFGKFENDQDRDYALGKAKELLSKIQHLEPLYKSNV
jgi:hypothetical protein